MSNFEEKKYKKILTDETPDLWDKIDSQLTDDMYTTDSSDKPSPRIKRSRVYIVSGIIAACICLLSIPLLNKIQHNSDDNKTNQAKGLKEDNELSLQGETDNSKEQNISEESSDNMTNSIDSNVKNNNTDNAAIINDNISDKDSVENSTNNTSEITLVMNITNTQYIDNIGLVYIGTVTKTIPQSLTVGSKIYISLRNLSRTDLRKSANITSKLVVTLGDISYTSSAKKPYYATSINLATSK